ncbi:hypothetical protein [Streptomyces sp. CO7]
MATNVGRVEASIVPETSGFAAMADRALTPAMSRLGRKLGETVSRAMTRALDFSGINTGLQRALDRAEAQAAGSGREVGRGFARAVRTEVSTGLRNLPEVQVGLSVDRTSLAEFRARIANLTRPVVLPVPPEIGTEALALYRARIANLTQDRTLRVNVEADNATGGLQDFSRAATGVTESASQATGALGSAGGGGGLQAALMAVGAAAGLSVLPALGAVVPMMAGAALGAGTMTVAFNGVGEALEQAGKDQEKYEEALKQLGPEQRAFTKALVGLKKEFAPIGREVQKAMLPAFTKAVKAAGPVVAILGDAMVDTAEGFANVADGVRRLMKDSGFQKDFTRVLKLGNGFVRDLAGGLGGLGRSFLDFGAASGPTLKALSGGLRDLLGGDGLGLPGMFEGLKQGIQGSSQFLDGFFGLINRLLPALGRFSGTVADIFGPVFKEAFGLMGSVWTTGLDMFSAGLRLAQPLLKDLAFGLKSVNQWAGIVGPVLKDVGLAVLGAFAPIGDEVEKARGPLQRLSGWIEDNRLDLMEAARQMGVAIIGMVDAAVQFLPEIVGGFRMMATGVLTAIDGIVSGAAAAFGWIPGIGKKFRDANTEFDGFKNTFIDGLGDAETKAQQFADTVGPRLDMGELKLNISSWERQLQVAKEQLSDKNLPREKRIELKARIEDLKRKIKDGKGQLESLPGSKTSRVKGNIADLEAKLDSSKKQLKSVPDSRKAQVRADINQLSKQVADARRLLASLQNRTVTITAVRRTVNKSADGGPVGRMAAGGRVQAFPYGGAVFGAGTGTSDSIPTWLSNGEFVIRAASVRKYGLTLMDAINEGRLTQEAVKADLATARYGSAASMPRPTVSEHPIPVAAQVDSSRLNGGQRLRLVVRDREFDAYVEEVADGAAEGAIQRARLRARAGVK